MSIVKNCWMPCPCSMMRSWRCIWKGQEIPTAKIRKAIRQATVAVEMVPVVCGSSYRNKGVQKLLDAIVDYMPSPTDIPAIKGVNPKTDEEEVRHLLMMTSPSPLWPSRS